MMEAPEEQLAVVEGKSLRRLDLDMAKRSTLVRESMRPIEPRLDPPSFIYLDILMQIFIYAVNFGS
jgi:hypothetical protein